MTEDRERSASADDPRRRQPGGHHPTERTGTAGRDTGAALPLDDLAWPEPADLETLRLSDHRRSGAALLAAYAAGRVWAGPTDPQPDDRGLDVLDATFYALWLVEGWER